MQQQYIEPDRCTGKFDLMLPPVLFGKVPPEAYQNTVVQVNNCVDIYKKEIYLSVCVYMLVVVGWIVFYATSQFQYFYFSIGVSVAAVTYVLIILASMKRHQGRVQAVLAGENLRLASYGINIAYCRPYCSKQWSLLVTCGSYQPVYVQNVVYTQHPNYV